MKHAVIVSPSYFQTSNALKFELPYCISFSKIFPNKKYFYLGFQQKLRFHIIIYLLYIIHFSDIINFKNIFKNYIDRRTTIV